MNYYLLEDNKIAAIKPVGIEIDSINYSSVPHGQKHFNYEVEVIDPHKYEWDGVKYVYGTVNKVVFTSKYSKEDEAFRNCDELKKVIPNELDVKLGDFRDVDQAVEKYSLHYDTISPLDITAVFNDKVCIKRLRSEPIMIEDMEEKVSNIIDELDGEVSEELIAFNMLNELEDNGIRMSDDQRDQFIERMTTNIGGLECYKEIFEEVLY